VFYLFLSPHKKYEMFFNRKKCSIFLILILIIVIVNNIKIINYVNKKFNCDRQMELHEINDDFLKVRFPHVFETLPHLKNNIKNYFKPKYVVTQYRHNVSIVIGVSTMKRQNATYLDKMLDSLFDSMTNDERSQVLVVLLIAEVSKLLLISSN
jgi:hypothetical protein